MSDVEHDYDPENSPGIHYFMCRCGGHWEPGIGCTEDRCECLAER